MLQTIVVLRMFAESMKDRLDREEGASMVEYGLLVALIAVIVAAAVGPLGTRIAALFNGITF